MAFKVKIKFSAKKDLEQAIVYYNNISESASKKFREEFIELHTLLAQNPFFEIRYNVVRTYKLKSFPYIVHFAVNENSNTVMIIAVAYARQLKTNFRERLR